MALRSPFRRQRRRQLMLVTGGSGFLGQHLANGPATERWELIAPSASALDIRNRESTVDSIRSWKPHAVVHLAYARGDRPTIVDGTRHVAEAAVAAGARLVHMSTDLVFGGRASGSYLEADAPHPVDAYGRDKYDAERIVAEICPDAVIVRSSLMYGTTRLSTSQQNVMRALTPGSLNRQMRFYIDEYRCPAHADDIAAAIAMLAGRADVSGPLHVAGPEPLSRAEFAQILARWFGLDPNHVQTARVDEAPEKRPTRVHLDTSLARTMGIKIRDVQSVLK